MKIANKLLKFLQKKGKSLSPLLILTHDHPDPDSLASAFALKYLLESQYQVHSRIVYRGLIGRRENKAMVKILQIPISELKFSDFDRFPHVALVDTQPSFENNPCPRDLKVSLVIDHHSSTLKQSSFEVIIDPKCGATSIILAQAFLKLGKEIPKTIATALACGIISETQNFGRESGKLEIKTYLAILPQSDLNILSCIQNPRLPKDFFKMLNKAIYNAFVFKGLIGVHLGFIKSPDFVSQMADFLLSYERAEWAICTGRYREKLFVSLRTNQPMAQADELLKNILRDQAGGHGTMAGGVIELGEETSEKEWKKMERTIVLKLIEQLNLPPLIRFRFPFRV